MTRYHIGIPKEVFLDLVKQHGLKCFVSPNQFSNKEEAIKAVESDRRKVFVIGECDNQTPESGCQGHPAQED